MRNWNERAMEFYQDLGAVAMDEWTTFRLNGDAMERLASPEAAARYRSRNLRRDWRRGRWTYERASIGLPNS